MHLSHVAGRPAVFEGCDLVDTGVGETVWADPAAILILPRLLGRRRAAAA